MSNPHRDLSEADPLVLVAGADDNFAIGLGMTLYSALTNLREGAIAYVYVIDGGIRQANRRRLERMLTSVPHVSVRYAAVRPDLARIHDLCFNEDRISRATYLKLLIPDLLPEHHGRALYLDSDMIVEQDLGQLWSRPMDGNVLLAVRDYSIHTLSYPSGVALYRELGLPDAPYFNAGLMLMDLKRWRAESISEQVLAYLRQYAEHVVYEDQDGLNAMLAGAWGELDLRWNQQQVLHDLCMFELVRESPQKETLRERREQLLQSPYIIHFSSGDKPWQFDCHHPARGRFLRYLKRSGWFTRVEWMRYRARYFAWLLQNPRAATRPFRHALRERLQPAGPGQAGGRASGGAEQRLETRPPPAEQPMMPVQPQSRVLRGEETLHGSE